MKKSNKSKDSIAKNIISGALLIGGLAVGFLSANIVAQANQSTDVSEQNKSTTLSTRNSNQNSTQDLKEITIPISEIKSEEDLVNLVVENGPQVLLDEPNGKMYLAYVNENNYIEVVEISEEELNSLIQQVNLISAEEEGVQEIKSSTQEESVGIPQEYWRTTGSEPTTKKNRKQLNSEEGKKAIEEAREYVRNQKK